MEDSLLDEKTSDGSNVSNPGALGIQVTTSTLNQYLENEERSHSCEFYWLGSTARMENVPTSDLDLLCVCTTQFDEGFWSKLRRELNVDPFLEDHGVCLYGPFESILESFMKFYDVYGNKKHTFLGSLLDSRPLAQERNNQFLQRLEIEHFPRVFSQTIEDIEYYQEYYQKTTPQDAASLYQNVKSEFYRTATMFPRDLYFYLYCRNGKRDYYHSTILRLNLLHSSNILSDVVYNTFKDVFDLCQLSRRGVSASLVFESLIEYRSKLANCLLEMKKFSGNK